MQDIELPLRIACPADHMFCDSVVFFSLCSSYVKVKDRVSHPGLLQETSEFSRE
jgi:hypothetical protein